MMMGLWNCSMQVRYMIESRVEAQVQMKVNKSTYLSKFTTYLHRQS